MFDPAIGLSRFHETMWGGVGR